MEPAPATRSDIVSIHEESYVDQVLNGSAARFSNDDPFSGIDQVATSVLSSTGGVLRAVESVCTYGGCAGSLSSGLHHAKFDHGEGYCTFNGLVIAAIRARDLGAQRVVTIDFDAIERTLAEIANPETIDLVIYNAGMDPHEKAGGPQGISTSVIRQRRRTRPKRSR